MKKQLIIVVSLILLIIGVTLIFNKIQNSNNTMAQDNLTNSNEIKKEVEPMEASETTAAMDEVPSVSEEPTTETKNEMTTDVEGTKLVDLNAEAKPAPVSAKVIVDWKNYIKPSQTVLKQTLDALAYKVTQEEGTERAGTSPLDKLYDRGIYVDILSGEPLYSSRDKYDSGTGWPSFTAPISAEAVTEHIDKKLFSTRTEIRSAIADNHLGHVFNDGPKDSTGLRYCMNGVALRFIPEAEMVKEGYRDWLSSL